VEVPRSTPVFAAMWSKFTNPWRFLACMDKFGLRHPLMFATMLGGMKGTGIDALIQCVERKEKYDWKRTMYFSAWGFTYVGFGQYLAFIKVFPLVRLPIPFIQCRRWMETTKSVFLDTCVHMPFVYQPLFYLSQQAFFHGGTLVESVSSADEIWSQNRWEDFTLNAPIFSILQAYNFYCNPPHLRVPFQCATGCIWLAILSLYRTDK
jgi:hypothetical protein